MCCEYFRESKLFCQNIQSRSCVRNFHQMQMNEFEVCVTTNDMPYSSFCTKFGPNENDTQQYLIEKSSGQREKRVSLSLNTLEFRTIRDPFRRQFPFNIFMDIHVYAEAVTIPFLNSSINIWDDIMRSVHRKYLFVPTTPAGSSSSSIRHRQRSGGKYLLHELCWHFSCLPQMMWCFSFSAHFNRIASFFFFFCIGRKSNSSR